MRAEIETTTPVSFYHRAPRVHLADFVELFWYWSGHPRMDERERILPMPNLEFVIQLRDSHPYAGVSGPRSESFIIDRREASAILASTSSPAEPFLSWDVRLVSFTIR